MSDRHDERVLYIFKNRIFKLCLHRENVKKKKEQRNKKDRAAYKHKSASKAVERHSYAQVADENESDHEQNEPYDSGLPEILAERPAEVLAHITLAGPYAFHTTVVKSGRRSADRNDRETVYQPQEMQRDDICHEI